MSQLALIPPDGDREAVALPPLDLGPIRHPVGWMQHRIRPGATHQVAQVGECQISSRLKAPLYFLANGEKIVITQRSSVHRPSEADGVLREMDDGSLKWLTHKEREAIEGDATQRGWPAVANSIALGWNGQFSFRAETLRPDGSPSPGGEGLRPPQLGALHAIGMHWSLSHAPATIVMPTGTGKTETMLSALVAYVRKPLLVVVPSDALRHQTARKFLVLGLLRQLGVLSASTPNPIIGVVTRRPRELTELEMFTHCNVIIGTMSALAGGEAAPFAREMATRVGALFVDEAHHVGADGWSAFRDAFADKPIIQFTATPFRRDGKLVDGQVIYNYPLRKAQQDGYFKKISFEPTYEVDPDQADRVIAGTAVARLRRDLSSGLDHLLMARCSNIERATAVHQLYQGLAADLAPLLIHSELANSQAQVDELRSGRSRIAVCVNMLGEGFDLPQLKLAAIHDLHKSLAVLLQFTGRFTRSAGTNIGDATVIANIADPNVSSALDRLYSEDADWNQVLSELSSEAAREHAELVDFLRTSQRLDEASDDETTPISHHLLRPAFSTLMFQANDFRPKRFHEGLGEGVDVHRVWLHQPTDTLFFVTRQEASPKWTRAKALRDLQWDLFILHYDAARKMLFLSSSDHDSLFEGLAKSVGGTALISGDVIFRSLGRITRLIFQNVGVKKHGRRNLRYAMYTGSDVAEALSLSERAGSVKSNLSGTGWEAGRPISIGCSYKGRVWSREQGPVPRFVKWCGTVGDKIADAGIDTSQIIANVLIPTEQDSLPDKEVLSLDWPLELLGQSEERIVFKRGQEEQPLSMFSLVFVGRDVTASTVQMKLVEANSGEWLTLSLYVGGEEGFRVIRVSGPEVTIKIGQIENTIENYFSDYPPLIRFVDLTELDGNLLISPKDLHKLTIPEERFDAWDWAGVDITKESIWRDGGERRDSIQWHTAQRFIGNGFDIVFDDDSAGEAADLVCLREERDHIRLVLAHCKFSGGPTAGARVGDTVEVCSQAVRSAKWKWKFIDLCRHVLTREKKLATAFRPSRFLSGRPADINRFIKVSRFKEVRPQILVVQPGLSRQNRTSEQSAVLAAALTYLKETIGVELDVVCSP